MSEPLEYSSIQPKLPIILASGSESRKQMLQEAGIIFEVIVSEADEDQIKSEISSLPFEVQVIHLAKAKASSVSIMHPSKIVIGGDQMCVLGDSLLHKPGCKEKELRSDRIQHHVTKIWKKLLGTSRWYPIPSHLLTPVLGARFPAAVHGYEQ